MWAAGEANFSMHDVEIFSQDFGSFQDRDAQAIEFGGAIQDDAERGGKDLLISFSNSSASR